MRIEITDEIHPVHRACCLGCSMYVAIAFLAIVLQAVGHRARAEEIEREKTVVRTRQNTIHERGIDAHR